MRKTGCSSNNFFFGFVAVLPSDFRLCSEHFREVSSEDIARTSAGELLMIQRTVIPHLSGSGRCCGPTHEAEGKVTPTVPRLELWEQGTFRKDPFASHVVLRRCPQRKKTPGPTGPVRGAKRPA